MISKPRFLEVSDGALVNLNFVHTVTFNRNEVKNNGKVKCLLHTPYERHEIELSYATLDYQLANIFDAKKLIGNKKNV